MKKLLISLLILVLMQVLFIGKSSTFGVSISDLDQKIEELSKENQSLEVQIVSLSSYTSISQRIEELGLNKTAARENQALEVALRP